MPWSLERGFRAKGFLQGYGHRFVRAESPLTHMHVHLDIAEDYAGTYHSSRSLIACSCRRDRVFSGCAELSWTWIQQ